MDIKDPSKEPIFAEEVKRHYPACVSYADASVGRVIHKLKQIGADKNTSIALWADHGWNLGEHNIWGKHNLFEESLRSPLIIVEPSSKKASQTSTAIVETLDIFPTLVEVMELPAPSFTEGISLVPIIENTKLPVGMAIKLHR